MFLLLLSSLLTLANAASILSIDHSSSSVHVKNNGREYSYSIQERHGIPLPQQVHVVTPLLKSGPPEALNIGPQISEEHIQTLSDRPQDNEEQLKITNSSEEKLKLAHPDQDQLKIVGYHGVPNPQEPLAIRVAHGGGFFGLTVIIFLLAWLGWYNSMAMGMGGG